MGVFIGVTMERYFTYTNIVNVSIHRFRSLPPLGPDPKVGQEIFNYRPGLKSRGDRKLPLTLATPCIETI